MDFEFPDKNGLPYKSNGGEMVWCEELGKEIPKGWEVKPFTKIVNLSGGGTPDTNNQKYWKGNIPFFTPADVVDSYYSISTEKNVTELGLKNSSTKLYPKESIYRDWETDRKSTRLNSSHITRSRMPSSA